MPSSFSRKPYEIKFGAARKSSLSNTGGKKRFSNSGTDFSTRTSVEAMYRSAFSSDPSPLPNSNIMKVPPIHEIYKSADQKRQRTKKRKASLVPDSQKGRKKGSRTSKGRADAFPDSGTQSRAVGPMASSSGGMPTSALGGTNRSTAEYGPTSALSPRQPTKKTHFASVGSPDKLPSVAEKKQFIRDRMQRLIPIQTEEDMESAVSHSLMQRYENAKTRIFRLWEWLEIPQEERQHYINTYFAYPSMENMKILSRQIETLLAHRVDVLRVLTKISEREGLLRKLLNLIYRFEDSKLDKSSLVLAEASRLLTQLKVATKKCEEAIQRWSEALTISKPFIWSGEDYTEKIDKDSSILLASKLLRILGEMSPQKRHQLFDEAYGSSRRESTSPERSTKRSSQRLHTEKRFHERYHFILQRQPSSPNSPQQPPARNPDASLEDNSHPLQHGHHRLSPQHFHKSGRNAPSPHTTTHSLASGAQHKRSPLQNRLSESHLHPPSDNHHFAESFHTYHTPDHHHQLALSGDHMHEEPFLPQSSTSPLRAFSEHLSETSFHPLDVDHHAYSSPSVDNEEMETAEVPLDSPPDEGNEFWAKRRLSSWDSMHNRRSSSRGMRLAPLNLSTHGHSDPMVHVDDLGAQTHRPHTRQELVSLRSKEPVIQSARRTSYTPLPRVKRSPAQSVSPSQATRRHTLIPTPSENHAQFEDDHESELTHWDSSRIQGFIPTLRDDRDNKMVIMRNKMKTIINRADFSETLNDLVKEDDAALIIQCAFRRFLDWRIFSECKQEHEASCEQVIFVQSLIRFRIHNFVEENRIAIQLRAVLKIQALFRGFVARREATVVRIVKETEKERKMLEEQQSQSAHIIQCNLRGMWERSQHVQRVVTLRNCVTLLEDGLRALTQQIEFNKEWKHLLKHLIPVQNFVLASFEFTQARVTMRFIVLTQSACRRYIAFQSSYKDQQLHASLIIQRGWRRLHAMHTLRALRVANRFQERIDFAVPHVQSWARGNAVQSVHKNDISALVFFQSCARSVISQQLLETSLFNKYMHEKRDRNAVRIQSQARIFLAKKRAKLIRTERLTREWAVFIQSCVRRFISMRRHHELKWEMLRTENAIRIQGAFRIHMARQQFAHLKEQRCRNSAAQTIQLHFRHYLAQKHKYCAVIQRAWRCHAARTTLARSRWRYAQHLNASACIQRAWRCFMAKKHFRQLQEENRCTMEQSSLAIQCAWRQYESKKTLTLLRQKYQDQRRQAAECIQRAWRCFGAQKKFKPMLEEHNNRVRAVMRIQRCFRCSVARAKMDELKMQRRAHLQLDGACTIQCLWRSFVARSVLSALRADHKKRNLAAKCIQKVFRAYSLRMQQIGSATLIQQYSHMSLALHYVVERQRLVETQAWIRSALEQDFFQQALRDPLQFYHFLDSVKRIQRVWRAYKQRQKERAPLISHMRTVVIPLQSMVRSDMNLLLAREWLHMITTVQSHCRILAYQQKSLTGNTEIIQRVILRNQDAHTLHQSLTAITFVQSVTRAIQVYVDYCELRSHFVFHWTEQMVGNSSLHEYCSLVIQQTWRRYVALKSMQHRNREVHATKIQCCWRRFRSIQQAERIKQENKEALQKHMADERFAVQIQRIVRGHQARRLAHHTRLHDKEALIRSLYSASFEKVSEEMEQMQSKHKKSLEDLLSNMDELQEKHNSAVIRVSEDVNQMQSSQQIAISKATQEMHQAYEHHSHKVSLLNGEIERLTHELQSAESRQKEENLRNILHLSSKHDESVNVLTTEIHLLRQKLQEAEQKQTQQNRFLRQMEEQFMEQIRQLKRSLQLKQDAFSMEPHQTQQRAHVVITLQRVVRGFLARRKAHHLREFCRGDMDKLRLWRRSIADIESFYLLNRELRRLRAIDTVQRAFRRFQSVQEHDLLMRKRNAFVARYVVPIQRVFRGHRDRNMLVQVDEAAFVVTRFLRHVHKRNWRVASRSS
mmetsp:Transcript_3313/g.12596  ORF Transcript_3313/g.12596 Transcript_3313/m.12596 type:complete len:1958 (-) Transcript_3313:616-6489(-)